MRIQDKNFLRTIPSTYNYCLALWLFPFVTLYLPRDQVQSIVAGCSLLFMAIHRIIVHLTTSGLTLDDIQYC